MKKIIFILIVLSACSEKTKTIVVDGCTGDTIEVTYDAVSQWRIDGLPSDKYRLEKNSKGEYVWYWEHMCMCYLGEFDSWMALYKPYDECVFKNKKAAVDNTWRHYKIWIKAQRKDQPRTDFH